MINGLLVALGSAIGGVARYAVSSMSAPASGFPTATFAVNVAGSFLIGLISGWIAGMSGGGAGAVRAFAVIGVCGGFTTFSTFSNEAFRMLERGLLGLLSLYVAGSVIAGLSAVWAGYMISRQ